MAVKEKRPPAYVDGTGVYGSYPVSWAVMQILIKRSDEIVPLEEIIRNPWLKKNCYNIGRFMNLNPPNEKEAKLRVQRGIAQLRRRGYEIETIRDNDNRLCYCTAETSIW